MEEHDKLMLGRLANAVLAKYGLELRHTKDLSEDRASHAGILENARRSNLNPSSIIDVGAAWGSFTRIAAQIFPGKDYLMVEPLTEYANSLCALIEEQDGRATWIKAAAAAEPGTVTFNVHDDLVGSSLLRETEGAVTDGRPRTVSTIRLDDEIRSRGLSAPHVLKLDVQGSELAVLDGARRILKDTELAILEVSFFDFFQGGSSMVEVISYMAERGFVPYDITTPLYRPLDGALAQLDLCFVQKSGALRRDHIYATPEQRREQNRAMAVALQKGTVQHH
jgi:FkbM family methyltransferase